MIKNRKNLIPQHIVRYGIAADQKYLIGEFLNTYDQLVINATMVAHQPSAIALFITQKAQKKTYFIDPQTHAFQQEIDFIQSDSKKSKGKIKKSFQKLLDKYGEPISTQISKNHSILPKDFNDSTIRKGFCERVIDFQLNEISDESQSFDVSEYYKFKAKEESIKFSGFRPEFVIAPYFFMESFTLSDWLPVNINCAKESIKIAKNENIPLAIQIVISKDVLGDNELCEELIKEYSKLEPDIFLIWVDSFEEQTASSSLLKSFINFLEKLKKTSIPVIDLYGGYFSTLLLHKGLLDGVTHSLEYGEQRAVIPVSGGVPVAKYYLPCLHYRMRSPDALRAIRALGGIKDAKAFYENVCDCNMCKKIIKSPETDFLLQYGKTKIIKGREYPTSETKDNSVRHYMWCKYKEFKKPPNMNEVITQLRKDYRKLERAVGIENTKHCDNWAGILEKIK